MTVLLLPVLMITPPLVPLIEPPDTELLLELVITTPGSPEMAPSTVMLLEPPPKMSTPSPPSLSSLSPVTLPPT